MPVYGISVVEVMVLSAVIYMAHDQLNNFYGVLLKVSLFYEQPPSMSRSSQIKWARWPKTDLVSQENVLESSNFANEATW